MVSCPISAEKKDQQTNLFLEQGYFFDIFVFFIPLQISSVKFLSYVDLKNP